MHPIHTGYSGEFVNYLGNNVPTFHRLISCSVKAVNNGIWNSYAMKCIAHPARTFC